MLNNFFQGLETREENKEVSPRIIVQGGIYTAHEKEQVMEVLRTAADKGYEVLKVK